MAGSMAVVNALQQMCGLGRAACRAALARAGGKVDAALAALIDAGKVGIKGLDPDTVDEAFFGRADAIDTIRQSEVQLPRWAKSDSKSVYLHEHWTLARKYALERLKKPRVLRERGEPIRRMMLAKKHPKRKKPTEAVAAKKPAGATTITLAPFGRLKADIDAWAGRDTLGSWTGFKGGPGVRVEVQQLDDGDDTRPPTAEQVAAYQHLKANEEKVADAIRRAVVKAYNALRKEGYFDSEDEEYLKLPDVKTPADLRRHVGLSVVHVLDHAKAGHAYVGFDLQCAWDDEHGLGVLIHKSRVIEVGQADMSFNHHRAKKDGGKKIRGAARK